MAAGKLIIKVAALAPVLAIAGMGYEARSPHHPFTFTEYSKAETARLDAYVPLIRLANETLPSSKVSSPAQTRKMVDYWVASFKEGKLQPVLPVFFEESDEEGPRNEVFLLWDRLISELQLLEYNENRAHNYEAAGYDMARIFALTRAVKYSDAMTVSSANTSARGEVARLQTLAPKLSSVCRKRLLDEVSQDCDPAAFHDLADRNKRNIDIYQAKLAQINEASDEKTPVDDTGDSIYEEQQRADQFCAKEERYLQAETKKAVAELRKLG